MTDRRDRQTKLDFAGASSLPSVLHFETNFNPYNLPQLLIFSDRAAINEYSAYEISSRG